MHQSDLDVLAKAEAERDAALNAYAWARAAHERVLAQNAIVTAALRVVAPLAAQIVGVCNGALAESAGGSRDERAREYAERVANDPEVQERIEQARKGGSSVTAEEAVRRLSGSAGGPQEVAEGVSEFGVNSPDGDEASPPLTPSAANSQVATSSSQVGSTGSAGGEASAPKPVHKHKFFPKMDGSGRCPCGAVRPAGGASTDVESHDG
jgi:hypothetical protein